MNEVAGLIRIFTFMIPMVLEIFLPCYFGNDLSIASKLLGESLFHSEWANGSNKLKQIVMIFMENTKKEIKITAFGLFNVNLATFTSIGNSAYSFFALLKQVNN